MDYEGNISYLQIMITRQIKKGPKSPKAASPEIK